MNRDSHSPSVGPWGPVSRRTALQMGFVSTAAASSLTATSSGQAAPASQAKNSLRADIRSASLQKSQVKKSINLWAFPYPQKMNLKECLQLAKDAGFDGIELNYDLENDLSPKASSDDFKAIRILADKIGIEISGLCSFLFWPYPLSSNDEAKRSRGIELAGKMAQAAHDLGVENLLVVPGAVHIPWRDDHEPVANDVCDKRAREAIGSLAKAAEKLKVRLNIENIFFNGYLMTPNEMNTFVDSFQSEWVKVHFDTGNIAMYQQPEHWIKQIGNRIQNIHFKEFNRKSSDYSLESFRPLLDGTIEWPSVMEALAANQYKGFVTFEYFHPYRHYPEALIYQTSDSLDRIIGRV